MIQSKRRIEELSFFNAICCILVVLIHVLSHAVSTAEPTSLAAAAVYFPWRLSAFVVPAFLFSGAVKMARGFDRPLTPRRYGGYLLGRIRKIYLPFVIWNVIYYLAFLSIGFVRGSGAEFFSYLLTGSLASPFYYVIIVMQFYALLPLWRWVVERLSWHTALLCAGVITAVSPGLGNLAGQFGLSFPYSDRIFTSYLLFWVMGLYVGRNYDSLGEQLSGNRPGRLLGILALGLYALLSYLGHKRGLYFGNLEMLKLFADCISIFLLLDLCVFIRDKLPLLHKPLHFLHRASFFVYLSHCLFLTLYTNQAQAAGSQRISTLLIGRAVWCYGGSIGLYALWELAGKLAKKVLNFSRPLGGNRK